uniref:Protein kinase domain-containing protein n=1 Tax=Amphilophus citrinellus TaxID=61819 RepID=A0A3Q0SHK2_AMPCI
FRVKCENLGGQSDYSEETTPIIPAAAVEIRAPAFKDELRNMSVKYKSNEIATLNLAKHTNYLVLHESFETEFELNETSSNVKIIELGQSRHLTPGDQIKVQYTTAEYAAPEIHQCDMVSTVTDMWSVGVLAYVLLSGLNPFLAETNQQMIDNISNAAYSYDDECFKQVSVEALDFTDRLMTKERKHRMTAAEALAHPWLTKPAEEISARAIPTGRHKRYYQTMVRKEWNTVVSAARVASGGSIRSQRGTSTPSAYTRCMPMVCGTCAHCDMSHVLVICILTALVEEPTKMIIAEQRASTDTAASMQKRFTASSAHVEAASMQAGSYSSSSRSAAAGYSFESMSATSMSAMVAESVVSMSSRSTVMEMSAHTHAESSSSSLKALTTGIKRGEMTLESVLNVRDSSRWALNEPSVTATCKGERFGAFLI